MTADKKFNLSIALATFNGSRYIKAQLDSLAAQSLLPIELVVCDDASSDDTVKIVQEFRLRAPFPVTIIQNEKRLGYADNFIKAAQLTRGDWIAFCDQDDLWSTEKLQTMHAAAQDEEVFLVTHASRVLAKGTLSKKLINSYPSGVFPPLTLGPMHLFFGHCLMFRRIILDVVPPEQRGFNPHSPMNRFPHDEWVTFLAGALGKTVILPDVLVSYRQHGGNVSEHYWRTSSFLARVAHLRSHGIDGLRHALQGSQIRAAHLREAVSGDSYVVGNATRGAAFFEDLANRMSRRLELWSSPSIARRMMLFWSLIKQGAYRQQMPDEPQSVWLLKDIIFGVICGGDPLIARRMDT